MGQVSVILRCSPTGTTSSTDASVCGRNGGTVPHHSSAGLGASRLGTSLKSARAHFSSWPKPCWPTMQSVMRLLL